MPAGEGFPSDVQPFVFQPGVIFCETVPELVFGAHGAVEHPEGGVEFLGLFRNRQMGLRIVGGPGGAHKAAEETGVTEKLRMGQGGQGRMETAHGQAGHGPVPLIRPHVVAGFDIGNQVFQDNLREKTTVGGIAGFPGHAVAHDDDHFLHGAFGDQPVGNAADVSLINPAGFVFTVSVLEIQHGISLRRIPGRRRIDETDLVLPGDFGQIIMPGDRAVGDALKIIPAGHIGHRDIHKVHGTAASVADGQIGAEHIRAVHLQEEIQEPAAHVKSAFPGAFPDGGQRKQRAETVDHHLMGIFGENPEMHFPVRENLCVLFPVPVRFTGIGIKRNGNVQRPRLLHHENPPVKCSVCSARKFCPYKLYGIRTGMSSEIETMKVLTK